MVWEAGGGAANALKRFEEDTAAPYAASAKLEGRRTNAIQAHRAYAEAWARVAQLKAGHDKEVVDSYSKKSQQPPALMRR